MSIALLHRCEFLGKQARGRCVPEKQDGGACVTRVCVCVCVCAVCAGGLRAWSGSIRRKDAGGSGRRAFWRAMKKEKESGSLDGPTTTAAQRDWQTTRKHSQAYLVSRARRVSSAGVCRERQAMDVQTLRRGGGRAEALALAQATLGSGGCA